MAGAFAGAIVALFFTGEVGNLILKSSDFIVSAILCEILGSFFLVFMYLTQTEESTKFSKDSSITTLVTAASYTAARAMTVGPFVGSVATAYLNPAVSLFTTFVMTFEKIPEGIEYVWIYVPMPFVGAICAVLFHELIYKKSKESIQEVADEEENEQLLDQ